MVWLETAASLIMGTIGTWMLLRGKKKMDTKMMIWGGVLIVLSYFLFSGFGGKNDSTNVDIKTLLQATPSAAPQQP